MSDQAAELMTVEDVAVYLRVAERTIYDWAQKGDIPCGKLGASWRFRRTDIDTWLETKFAEKSSKKDADPVLPKDVLCKDMIKVYSEKISKDELLTDMIELISKSENVLDKKTLKEGVFKREELMSTGIGLGIAVPHVRIDSVKDIVMAVGISKEPVEDYETLDDKPVQIIFMIVANSEQHAKHLKLLAQIAEKFKDDSLRKKLIKADMPSEIANILL